MGMQPEYAATRQKCHIQAIVNKLNHHYISVNVRSSKIYDYVFVCDEKALVHE